jgi:hypothetical protein
MIQNRAQLFLNRLVLVSNTGAIAYDESFHHGVNIIRGENSSGKSTIANFIFYVLGGDFRDWTNEAYKCQEVIAEVELSGATVTLKRNINEYGLQPLYILWDRYDETKKSSLNWQVFPYKQTENNTSFSNVLFNALAIPEVKNEVDGNITVHQLLRLMYVDQDSPTQNLFRFERFDLPVTRLMIAEVLLGIFDNDLYANRLLLRSLVKNESEKKQEYDGIFRVFKDAGNNNFLLNIEKQLAAARKTSVTIDEQLAHLRQQAVVKATMKTALTSEIIQEEFVDVKNSINKVQSAINAYEVEISDSEQFIGTIRKRVYELDHSLLTRKVFGELPLTHCPQCLSPLETHIDEGHCMLCKKSLSDDVERANTKRLRQELEMQLKESSSLLENKKKTLSDFNLNLPRLIDRGRLLQKQLDTAIGYNQSTRDQRIDKLIFEKGSVEKSIEYLIQQKQIAETLEAIKRELAELAGQITQLRRDIALQEFEQQSRYDIAMSKIREITLYILNNDLERQNEFKTGKHVVVDFLKDTFLLDDTNNFSASSKTYFKNAVLFAIFFASVELDFFRYPRFIICDNMEDKGMEKERTQNFQNLITQMSRDRSDKPHQIIFTTSMIADDLNGTTYCVGQYYRRENKSLKV